MRFMRLTALVILVLGVGAVGVLAQGFDRGDRRHRPGRWHGAYEMRRFHRDFDHDAFRRDGHFGRFFSFQYRRDFPHPRFRRRPPVFFGRRPYFGFRPYPFLHGTFRFRGFRPRLPLRRHRFGDLERSEPPFGFIPRDEIFKDRD